jgi:hypothetical protein
MNIGRANIFLRRTKRYLLAVPQLGSIWFQLEENGPCWYQLDYRWDWRLLGEFRFPFSNPLPVAYSRYSAEWVSGSLGRRFMIVAMARASRALMSNG